MTGHGGDEAFSDHAVADPAVIAVRQKVAVTVDQAIKSDQVDMTVTLTDGRTLHNFIEHAVGSQQNPMTDAQLEEKFTGLSDGILPPAQSRQLMDLCWNAWMLDDAGKLGRAGATVRV